MQLTYTGNSHCCSLRSGGGINARLELKLIGSLIKRKPNDPRCSYDAQLSNRTNTPSRGAKYGLCIAITAAVSTPNSFSTDFHSGKINA